MRRATAITAGRFYSLLSTPPPSYRHSLSLSSPRFHFYSPNSATDSSSPSSCYAIATNYSTLAHTPSIPPFWSLSPREYIEAVFQKDSPLLFKDAADFISRIKLFLNGSSPDVLASEKPSMADLMKFLLSYVSVPLVSPLVYSRVYAERYNPQSTQFPKQRRGRMKGISTYEGDPICFGSYALQALEPAWITSNQIEAGRRAMTRNASGGGKVWVRVFPDKPVTAKPTETRMGKGKGSLEYWVAVVKPGQILYEISGVTEKVARIAVSTAASKMPIRTQFLTSCS